MAYDDLLRTINDDDENVGDDSETSAEEDAQPSTSKNNKWFSEDFQFSFDAVVPPPRQPWEDLEGYLRKCREVTGLEKKIAEARSVLKKDLKTKNTDEENSDTIVSSSDEGEEMGMSEEDLVDDKIKVKEARKQKKKKEGRMDLVDLETVEKMEFEDAPPYDESASFHEMNLSAPLLKAITTMNFTHPTPIQASTIPLVLSGRDICGCAATGTGKTAAYMLPTLERLLFRPSSSVSVTRVLVLVPTRELGVQVYQVTCQLAQFTSIEVGLSVGGLDLKLQESMLRKHPDIVIATPGRLIDHLKNTPSFTLDHVEVLVLDEADRMLDEYFHDQMAEIIRECSRARQTLLFSATMTEAVNALAAVSLSKPVRVFVDNNQTVAANLRQEFIRIRKECVGDREPLLAALVCRTFCDHVMIFVQTKKQAHRLYILLGLLGLKAGELHGDLTQARRLEALRKFKNEEIDILIATDVAARGLDIHGVKTVINFMLPPTLEQYIHRVGRTARAGKSGVSVSLAGEAERKLVKKILRLTKAVVKERIIPPSVLKKYRKKVSTLEETVHGIIQEEWEEKTLAKAEVQANKAEKLLLGSDGSEKRAWFQTHKERAEEKDRFRLEELKSDKRTKHEGEPGLPKKKKSKKAPQDTPEERMERDMQKIALLQARVAKSKKKHKKIKSMTDSKPYGEKQASGTKSRRRSAFENDLTDVSNKNVKRLRHEANQVQNQKKLMKKGSKKSGQPPGRRSATNAPKNQKKK